jgi:hypothetical protein
MADEKGGVKMKKHDLRIARAAHLDFSAPAAF